MACKKKKAYKDKLDNFVDEFQHGFNTKKFKEIKDLEFMREIAIKYDEKAYSKENLKKEFNYDSKIKTAIGDIVRLSYKFLDKKLRGKNARGEDRTKIMPIIRDTIKDPLFVVDKHDDKDSKIYYAPYIDPSDNLVHLMSVTSNKDNKGQFLVSSYQADMNALYDLMNSKKNEVIHKRADGESNHNKGGLTSSFVTKILAFYTNKVNDIKSVKGKDNKIDGSVDLAFDTIMKAFDIGATPVKKILGAMNKNIDADGDWFKVTDLQKEVSTIINDHRNIKAGIYDQAGEIKTYLGTLSKEDSKSLVHALGGDLDPKSLNENLQELYGRFRDVIDAKANELVDLGVLDEKHKIDDYLKRYYAQYVTDDHHAGSSLAYDKLKKRKDLSLEERIAIGMVEDADFVIPQTIAEQNIQIEKAKTLKTLADKFALEYEEDGYVKISDESAGAGVKRWGALAGKYVPVEVKAELDHAKFVANQTNILETGLYPLVDHLKVNMTVKNPVTHVYNIASNILLAGLNGDMVAVGKVLYMRYKTPNKFKALLKTANKYGLNSYLDDFEKAHIELMPDGKTVNPVMSIFKNLYMTQDSKLGKGARKLYDWEDKIFKLSAFKKLMDEGVPEKLAYKQAVDVYVDYSTPLPQGIRVLDKSGLMPFLHYQYKSTPAVAKVMLKHPLRTLLMGTGVATLGASAFQNDDEEMLTPTWANDKFNLFGVAEWVRLGNGYYINAGRMIPGTKFEFELGGFVKGALDMIGGKTPLGYNIGSVYDTDTEKYAKRALAMAENYLPSITLGRYAQRGVQIGLAEHGLSKPKKNYYDEDMTISEVGTRALGVRRFNESKELHSKQRKAKNRKKYLDKKKPSDKKTNQAEYNKSAQRIKRAGKKAGIDLNAKKDKFNFPKASFDF